MTKMLSKVTHKVAPYIPRPIRENWITICTCLAIAWFSFVSYGLWSNSSQTHKLVVENSHRISDIQETRKEGLKALQASRVSSCKANYDGTKKMLIGVFKPFAEDPAQFRHFVMVINTQAEELKKGCVQQTKLRKER